MTQHYWLLKTEPETFSWQNLLDSKTAPWDGVRNYQARNNLKSMKVGDLAFFYHSGKNPSIVGIVKIVKESYPDKTDPTNKFVCVDVEYFEDIKTPITLESLRKNPKLSDLLLLRHSRLSVVPITKSQWNIILDL